MGQIQNPEPFDWNLLTLSIERRVLLLDYDGTLAPFRPKRMEAVPYSGVREELSRIAAKRSGQISIISGRPINELQELLGDDLFIDLWGAHGWEHRHPDGKREVWEPDRRLVDRLTQAAFEISSHVTSEALDVKQGSVAIHTRGLAEPAVREIAEQVGRLWDPATADGRLRLREFDGGWELRIDTRTKATAVKEIRSQHPASSQFAYLGDDDTDEDAFAELAEDDWPILVRDLPRPSRARFWIKPPVDLLRFLRAFTNA